VLIGAAPKIGGEDLWLTRTEMSKRERKRRLANAVKEVMETLMEFVEEQLDAHKKGFDVVRLKVKPGFTTYYIDQQDSPDIISMEDYGWESLSADYEKAAILALPGLLRQLQKNLPAAIKKAEALAENIKNEPG
jgi:hypothetical protein